MFSRKADGLRVECENLLVQQFRNGCGRGFPLTTRIFGIIDRDHRLGFFYGFEIRFELAAHGFLVGNNFL